MAYVFYQNIDINIIIAIIIGIIYINKPYL